MTEADALARRIRGGPKLRMIARCFSLVLAFLTIQPVVADESDTLAEVVTGWELNRQLIGETFLCEFTIDVYDYSDVQDPILLYTQAGIWARLGDFERYSVECKMIRRRSAGNSTQKETDGAGEEQSSGMGGGGPCWSEHYLQSGDAQLRYSKALSVANVQEGVEYSRGITTTPLSYGVMGANEHRSLPEMIRDLTDAGGSQPQVDLLEDHGTGGTITLRTTRREASSSGVEWANIMEWRVDPKSGYLPLEVTVFDAPDIWVSKTKVYDVRKLDSGGYWPASVQTISSPTSALPRMFRIRTERLAFDPAEVKDALSLPLPAGTQIVNPENMGSSFTHDSEEIKPAELTQLLIRAAASLERWNSDGG